MAQRRELGGLPLNIAETAARRREPADLVTLNAIRTAPAVRPLLDRDALATIDEIQRDAQFPAARETRKTFDLFIQRLTDNVWQARRSVDGHGRITLPGARGAGIVW